MGACIMSLSLNSITVNNTPVGVNFKNTVTQYLIGNHLNEWQQGVPNETDPTTARNMSNRITSLNNIAFPGFYLEYEIPTGWYPTFNSWDGNNISSFNDDTNWITKANSGIIKMKNKFFFVSLRKEDSSNITPLDAPDIKIHIFDEIFDDDVIKIDGDSSQTLLNFKTFTNYRFKAGNGIRIKPRFKTWPADENIKWLADYSRFTVRYKDINNTYHEFFSVNISQSLNDYYDIIFPDNMNTEHQMEIAVRCNNRFLLVFDIEDIVSNEIYYNSKEKLTYYANAYVTGLSSSSTELYNGWIDGNAISNYSDGCQHIVIKVEPNDKIQFKASSTTMCAVAFVKSYSIETTTQKINYPFDFCTGFSSRVALQAGQVSQEYIMPSDANYALIGYHFENEEYNHLPEYFLINDYDILTSAVYKIQNLNPVSDDKMFVNSQIFKSLKLAWTDKDHQYESWPNGGVMADGDRIVCIYNSSSAHVAHDLVSDVIMRVKTTLGDWDTKTTVMQHTATVGYGNPSCCILPNGDYMVIASILTSDTVSRQIMSIKMMKSSDKGNTWTDCGNVQVNGEDVQDECMMDLFCTSYGKLISFVGGTNNRKFIASDDSGLTWRFVGNELSSALEACFYERTNGEIIAILRQNGNTPALIKLNANLTYYEILYEFGQFNFPAYYNPSSIIKLQDGRLYLLGGARTKDSSNHFKLYESIVTEEDLLQNKLTTRVIYKAMAQNLMDFAYAQGVIANDGNIYGYFYDAEITGTTQIYEMIGC